MAGGFSSTIKMSSVFSVKKLSKGMLKKSKRVVFQNGITGFG